MSTLKKSKSKTASPRTIVSKKTSSIRTAIRPKRTSPTSAHLGWADFDRNGGAIIKEVAANKSAKSVGTSLDTPHVRLRSAEKYPKSAAKVRKEHDVLFEDYKSNKRQVRTLIAIDTPFLIRSGENCILVDRHPDFPSNLIDKEIKRRKVAAVGKFARSLKSIMEAIIRKNRQKQASSPDEFDINSGRPLALLQELVRRLQKVLPPDLYRDFLKFLGDRSAQGLIAKAAKKTEKNLGIY